MKKNKRELKSLDNKQLAQVQGGDPTSPIGWKVPKPDTAKDPTGPCPW
jgi:bacteriocin-like protein